MDPSRNTEPQGHAKWNVGWLVTLNFHFGKRLSVKSEPPVMIAMKEKLANKAKSINKIAGGMFRPLRVSFFSVAKAICKSTMNKNVYLLKQLVWNLVFLDREISFVP